jgi:Na+-translocating ferredoxin:NAD+ oxidoreductase RnfD subunit
MLETILGICGVSCLVGMIVVIVFTYIGMCVDDGDGLFGGLILGTIIGTLVTILVFALGLIFKFYLGG